MCVFQRRVLWQININRFSGYLGAVQYQSHFLAALPAERVREVNARLVGDSQSIDKRLAATKVDIANAHLVDAIIGRREADARIGAEVIVVVGKPAAFG